MKILYFILLNIIPIFNFSMANDNFKNLKRREDKTLNSHITKKQKLNSSLQFNQLPTEIQYEIFNQLLTMLIKECISSWDIEKCKIFLKQLGVLALINKEFKDVVREYIPIKIIINNVDNKSYQLYEGESLLAISIKNNWKKLWKFIFTNIDLPKKEKNIALKWFALNNNLEMVQKLQELGANHLDACITINGNNFDLFKILEKNTLTDRENQKALKIAVKNNRIDAIKYLITNNADTNYKYDNKQTLLMVAIKLGYKSAAKLLLSCINTNVNLTG